MSQPLIDSASAAVPPVVAATSGAAAIMVEPSVYWLGVPLPVVLAALCGSAAALSILGAMSRVQAFGAVAMGTAAGTYLPKLIGWKWGVPPDVWPAVGFVVGIGAHLAMMTFIQAMPRLVDAILARFGGGKP